MPSRLLGATVACTALIAMTGALQRSLERDLARAARDRAENTAEGLAQELLSKGLRSRGAELAESLGPGAAYGAVLLADGPEHARYLVHSDPARWDRTLQPADPLDARGLTLLREAQAVGQGEAMREHAGAFDFVRLADDRAVAAVVLGLPAAPRADAAIWLWRSSAFVALAGALLWVAFARHGPLLAALLVSLLAVAQWNVAQVLRLSAASGAGMAETTALAREQGEAALADRLGRSLDPSGDAVDGMGRMALVGGGLVVLAAALAARRVSGGRRSEQTPRGAQQTRRAAPPT